MEHYILCAADVASRLPDLSMKLAAATAAAAAAEQSHKHHQHFHFSTAAPHGRPLPTSPGFHQQQQQQCLFRGTPAAAACSGSTRAASSGGCRASLSGISATSCIFKGSSIGQHSRDSTVYADASLSESCSDTGSPVASDVINHSRMQTAAAASAPLLAPQMGRKELGRSTGNSTKSATQAALQAATAAVAGSPAAQAAKQCTQHAAQSVSSLTTSLSVRPGSGPALGRHSTSKSCTVTSCSTNGCSTAASSGRLAAEQHVQQVAKELHRLATPQAAWRQPLQHESLDEDEWEEVQQQEGQPSTTRETTLQHPCAVDASSSQTSNNTSCNWAGDGGAVQQQQYSIHRTGGAYKSCSRDTAAEELLAAAATYNQLASGTNGNGTGRAAVVIPWQDVGSMPTATGAVVATGRDGWPAAAPAASSGRQLRTVSSNACSRLTMGLPKEAVAIMQDFYRQHCCVAWPLVKATANAFSSSCAASNPGDAAAAQHVGTRGGGAGSGTWHVACRWCLGRCWRGCWCCWTE